MLWASANVYGGLPMEYGPYTMGLYSSVINMQEAFAIGSYCRRKIETVLFGTQKALRAPALHAKFVDIA